MFPFFNTKISISFSFFQWALFPFLFSFHGFFIKHKQQRF
ncbi:unnamed protein product [Arabidopsis halleri]